MSGTATKLAQRRQHTGIFANDQQQKLAQDTARKTNSHADQLAALSNHTSTALAADTTLAGSAGVYSALLSASTTTALASGALLLNFSASGTHPTGANATVYFKLFVDNVFVRGCYTTVGVANSAFTAAIVANVAVTRGAHVVTVTWSTDANSARINAVSSVNEHAALLVQEAT